MSAVGAAPIERRLLTVASCEPLGAYRLLRVEDPAGPEPAPGQFAMLATAERWGGGEDERPYLPRAFSVTRWRPGEAEFLLEDVGPGSRRLCELRPGARLWALGPFGRPFTIGPLAQPSSAGEPPSTAGEAPAILVGGGAGIAPLVILHDALARRSAAATALLGFRDAEHAAAATLIEGARLATEDGSVGTPGLVTEPLSEALAATPGARVYACGPTPMLEAVRALCQELDVTAELALEAPMACGFGACHGCVVPRRDGGYLRTCLEGPVVEAALLAPLVGPPAIASALDGAPR